MGRRTFRKETSAMGPECFLVRAITGQIEIAFGEAYLAQYRFIKECEGEIQPKVET